MSRLAIPALLILGACTTPTAPAAPPLRLEEADRLMLEGNHAQAAEIYDRVSSERTPAAARAAVLAAVCRLKIGQAPAALAALKRLRASELDAGVLVRVLVAESEAHRLLGHPIESVLALEEARRLPQNAVEGAIQHDELLYKMGCAYARACRRERAAECFVELLDHHPTSFRSFDAALRLAYRGFGVSLGEGSAGAPGYATTLVKVDSRNRTPATVAIVGGMATYEDALQAADRMAKNGIRAEPLP